MKKVFLFLTMLLFAFVGTMRADEVTIGDPTATTTNSYLPTYSLYEKAISQQMYTADEIGMAGTINTLTMWLKNTSSYARNLNVYMKEVDVVEFASTSAWVSMSDADLVGSFSLVDGISSPVETAVELTTPFEYTGAGTLVICLNDVTGSWSSGAGSVVMTTTEYQALYAYRDGTSYDPSNPGVNGTRLKVKSVIMLDITPAGGGGALTTTPDVLDLGNRPNGAWMAPYVFTINGSGTTVNALDFSGNYFTYNAVLPATLTASRPLEVTLTTGEAEEGPVNSTMTVLFGGNRDAQQFNVTANAYNPVEGDVWENAINVTNLPYSDNAPAGIYKNYDLPVATEGADAMYKVTFDNDVMFSAGTAGENAVTAIYPEGFNGQPGPMADNNYVYNGPQVNPGPMNMWFSYAYTGTNTWYGTSAGGGFYYGYKIPAEYIAELGLAGTTITTIEAAAREAYPYYCFIFKGGATPDDGELVSYGVIENTTALYFFDITLEVPVLVNEGDDIWVICYSDSPYAAYCGRYPVDTNNGKIWTYNPNASSPAWSSNANYTPVIYTRFIELPTGRETTVNLAEISMKKGNGVMSEVAAIDGTAMGTPKAEMKKANRGNRDMQTILEEGFENGIGEWTMNHCDANTGVTSSYAGNTGYYAFRFYYTTNYPQYLISPELDDNDGVNFTFYAARYSSNYPETFKVGYSSTTNDPTEFTWSSEVTCTTLYGVGEYQEYSYDFPAGTKYVSIACTSNDQFYLFVDDITIQAEPAAAPTPGEATYQIEDMYVPAGTYYLAVASTTEEFNVDMAVAEIPVPEQAIVIAPYDGETFVEAPYLAEWMLGDYTVEMQVLVGTQYPPQTALIDWTDELVESAFLMDLENNQTYFMQVNARNAAGTTEGEIYVFSTPIDPVEGFAVETEELYPGDAAVFTWDANRTLQSYNLYMNGEKVNETPITTNTYSVEGLEYNMDGYYFQITAVYDAGESMPSDAIIVYMTGEGSVNGHVYDLDVEHPIAGATVIANGADQFGVEQTYTFTTDENGFYEGELLSGQYFISIATEGYENEGVVANIVYNELTEAEDIITHEFYYPLGMITAAEEEAGVNVEWSWTPAEMIVDFETGDFSQANFVLPTTYPWTVTTTNPHEGTYCMKSTCEGVASGLSEVEVTVDVPYDGKMGFWVAVSSEANYDKFHFYIDGVEKGAAISGVAAYAYKEFDVTEGTHTYKWAYQKDSSVNSNDDCAYVDDITLYRYEAPLPPVVGATTYDFEDGTMQGWTTIDANNDGYDWVMGSQIGGIYLVSGASLAGSGHESSNDMVCSGSFSNATGAAITPDNYLVSPQISAENGAQIQFWACAQDASYPAEHFGVAVSTTTATASAFTMVQEWTMTAKSDVAAEVNSEVRGTRAQGAWYQYAVDLSAYAGQDIYVAIRHFNCNDQFILNVDDITLATGGTKLANGDRTFQSFNLYRRNNITNETPELIVEGTTDFAYVDAAWATLPYGEYQWGVAATYEGYAPVPERSRDVYTYTFDSGLEGWTNIDADGDGNIWYNSANSVAISGYDYSALGHNGTGCFMVSQSYTDLTYDAFDANNYLVSPQKYQIDANSSITFWQDYANDSYPDYYEVMVSTAANPGANDFTSVWSVGSKGKGNGAKMRNINSRYENWTEYTVSLAAYAGQEVWIAFHHEDYDNYEVWIDDVTITAGSSTPVPPTPGPTGDGISEILWSNVIEKDMTSDLTFNVSLNNGQSAYGVAVTVANEEHTYTATVDETGVAELTVRKGVYDITVSMAGYNEYMIVDEAIEENTMTFNVVLNEIVAPVDGLYVSPTGWAMWEGATPTPTPGPGPQPGGGSFTEGFENGLPADWTIVDANNDGYTWCLTSDIPTTWTYYASITLDWYRTGTNAICSGSYINGAGALTPDEYLVMGQQSIANGTTLSFWAAATDASYPADHFGVAVSDNGTDWTMVQEWTLTAKKGGANGGRESRDGEGAKLGTWYQFTADLSAHAGNKYIAIRHFNCNDQYIMCVDDIELGVANKGDRTPLYYKVMCDNTYLGETEYPFYQMPVEGMEEGSEHTTSVAAFYATGMGDWMSYDWTYAPCSNYAGTTEYNVAANGNDVTLTWTLNGTPGPGPGPQPGTGWTEGFENGLPADWTIVDANNDGYTWCLTSNIPTTWTYYASLTLDWYRTGTNAICSGSYINGAGALTPDEYLVMGQQAIANGTTLSFWAAATDASYPADHFGVAVSDNGTDWTMVQEWTLTAKSGAANGGRESRDGEGAKLGTWYQFTADLSAHAGNKYIAIRHFNCNDQYIMCVDDIEFTPGSKGDNRAMWDLVGSFTGTSAGQQAVATDGNYIYTASWQSSPTGGHTFYQYTMDGTFVEGFEIAGATGIRDLTTDGEYFYGTSGGAQIFILDFTTRTLVGTINCSGLTSRHISYDPERDGFWSGNWSTLALYSRTGALIQNGPAPTSAYGSAYYKDSDNVEHLFLFCQPNSDCKVYDYNITTGTLGSNVVLDYTSTAPGCTGIAGGCFIGEYNGNTCWYGNSQQDPNLIAIYELEAGTPGPGPGPQPGNILGVMIWRDGEPITMAPVSGTSYVDAGVEAGEHEYCVRVVYSDYAMSCEECETVEVGGVSCDPVTNLTAELYTYNGNDGALVQFTEPAGATEYKVYVDGQLLGSISAQPIFINFEGTPDGDYEIGIVAVYANCESDMATVMFTWDMVEENMIVNAIYPNPTSGDLHIEATAMTQISIYNAMGQMVYSQDVNADEMVIDMSQFEAGVYMVNIITENGSAVKRITVVK